MDLIRKIRKALRIIGDPTQRRILFMYGVAAAIEHLPVLRQIRPDLVVDVGANRGQFTAAVLSVCPKASVLAFEPLAAPAATYRKAFACFSNVSLHECALGVTNSTHDINVSNRDDSSSLLPIGAEQTRLFAGTDVVGRVSVRVVPLVSILARAHIPERSMLKVDVQGFELMVLKGAAEVLDSFGSVYVECSFFELYIGQPRMWEIDNLLYRHGFKLSGVYNCAYDGGGLCIQADFLFLKIPSSDGLRSAFAESQEVADSPPNGI